MDWSQELDTSQLVVVKSDHWESKSGVLSAYELRREKWEKVIGPFPVQLGRAGMAWGPGLHDPALNSQPLKQEGDGKTPSGIFRLTGLYGYGELQARMPYLQVDTNTFCVDDPKSAYYNQIVRGEEVQKDWNSAETMRMESNAYKYGIVVGYNTERPKAGAGSCIFMHLGEPGGTTAGCTAMAEADILKLINWLDKDKHPLVLQAPEEFYTVLAKRYKLP